jgi:hypothetical protein
VLVCSTWYVPVATVVSADGWADPFGSLGMAGSFERDDEEQVVILTSMGRVRPLLRPPSWDERRYADHY